LNWIVFFVLTLLANASLYGQDLVAHYKLDNSGIDESHFSNNGIINGNVTPIPDRFNNACSALLFDGQTGYIEIPSSSSLESLTDAITITAWYKLTKASTENYWLTVLCKGVTTTELPSNPQFRLQVQQNTNIVLNTCSPYNPTASSTISTATSFTKCDPDFLNHLFEPGVWHFYALVFDGSTVVTYMDDRKVFEYPFTQKFVTNNSSLFIAKDEPGAIEFFNGALDDVRIYNKALSQSQVQNIYNEPAPISINIEEFELEMPSNKLVFLSRNNCQATVKFNKPAVISHCGNVTLNQIDGLASGSAFDVGKHLISYMATSTSGYSQSCSFYVEVKDTISPVLVVSKNIVEYCEKGDTGKKISYNAPTASDNCKVKSIALKSGLTTGSFFPIGKTAITFTAIDESNNIDSRTFFVEIRERDSPKQDVPKIDSTAITTTPQISHDTVTAVEKAIDVISLPILKTGNDNISISAITEAYNDRKLKVTKIIEVDSSNLLIELYDNAEIDGDSISLFLNNNLILSHQILALQPKKINITIDTTADNKLALFAENLGSIPPNTALLIMYDGTTRHEINLSSDMTTNGSIILRRRQKK